MGNETFYWDGLISFKLAPALHLNYAQVINDGYKSMLDTTKCEFGLTDG